MRTARQEIQADFFASGDLNLFKMGTITALGGNNGYASGVNTVAQGGLEEYLYFPRFIGFDTIAGAELRLTHDIDLGSGDVALIEFQAGGQWNTLGLWDPQNVLSTNWYNTGSSAVFDAWTGTIGQQTSVWPLYAYNYTAAPLV